MKSQQSLQIVLGLTVLLLAKSVVAQKAFDHQYSHLQIMLTSSTHQGRVDYQMIQNQSQELIQVIQDIENVSQSELDAFSPEQKMAFWINAYNSGVIKIIVDHYPIKRQFGLKALTYPASSIQQIPKVWDRPVLRVAGQNLSLNDIEHTILRAQFKDPRIHFALVCASIGCPVIRSQAYTAEKLNAQLADQIQLFLNDALKARYDASTDVLQLSPIFKWFKTDFEQDGGTIAFLKVHSPAGLFDDISQTTKIHCLAYDWSLNDVP